MHSNVTTWRIDASSVLRKAALGLTCFFAAICLAIPAEAQNTCDAGKLKCLRKKFDCLMKVHAKAQKVGLPPDPAKLQKCDDKFDGGALPEKGCFTKLEAKQNVAKPKTVCSETGDAAAAEADIDGYVDDMLGLLSLSVPPPPEGNLCAAGKLGCVRKRLSCWMKVFEKAKKTGLEPADAKLYYKCANSLLTNCFAELENKQDPAKPKTLCSQTGDGCLAQKDVDIFVALRQRGAECITESASGCYCDLGLTIIDRCNTAPICRAVEWVKPIDCGGATVACTSDPSFCSLPMCMQNAYSVNLVRDLYVPQLNGQTNALHPILGGGLTPFGKSCYAGLCDWRFTGPSEFSGLADDICSGGEPLLSPFWPGQHWTNYVINASAYWAKNLSTCTAAFYDPAQSKHIRGSRLLP